ncbi:amino acid racemase [Neomoorella humiferrea]|uniref:Putative amino-acid racemase n=1 Tax=Neomoorella humiferrea TaxID=676965 RepID=A0A2T0AM68_9FIRM|nr:amino acid racemase [Moorella humiferrea]PRR69846.1 putative amino-acid racemase [Moorella humiferrea]
MTKKVLGIIGGMGPEATVDFMDKIIKATPAKDDCDHIHMLVDNNPQVPSRVQAILGSGESPAPVLIQMAQNLEKWGADFLAIPCNTAHIYYSEIKNAVNIPVLNIVESARNRILSELPHIKKIGLLATKATVVTKLYHNVFNEDNIDLVTPDEEQQQKVMEVIFAVKANQLTNNHLQDLREIISQLVARGAEAILFACTELSVIAKSIKHINVPVFDAAQILAEEVVRIVKG